MLGLGWLVVQFYALPYLIEQEGQHLGQALRIGLLTALAAPGYTLVLALAAAGVALFSVSSIAPLFL